MAKNKSGRQVGQRDLDSARSHVDGCGQRLIHFLEMYQDHHPELAEPIDNAMQLLLLVDQIIEKVREMV